MELERAQPKMEKLNVRRKKERMNEWTFNWTFMVAWFYHHLDCFDSVCRIPSSALSSCLNSSLWLIPF